LEAIAAACAAALRGINAAPNLAANVLRGVDRVAMRNGTTTTGASFADFDATSGTTKKEEAACGRGRMPMQWPSGSRLRVACETGPSGGHQADRVVPAWRRPIGLVAEYSRALGSCGFRR